MDGMMQKAAIVYNCKFLICYVYEGTEQNKENTLWGQLNFGQCSQILVRFMVSVLICSVSRLFIPHHQTLILMAVTF
jgi:hypothetical protein